MKHCIVAVKNLLVVLSFKRWGNIELENAASNEPDYLLEEPF
ncbi:hypothetical protein [Acinetobacter baumannii]